MRRVPFRISAAAAVLLTAMCGAAGPATAAPAAFPLTGLSYVALGDSFTADWGVDPVAADQPSAGCRQSSNDYPHQVAADLGLTLHDVSCAGAETTNMTQPQTDFPDGEAHPAAPPQFDALTPTTDVVSIGIGGNDFGFSTIAGACAVNPITGYVFGDGWSNWYSSCKAYYDPSGQPADDTLRARILNVVGPAVQKTVAAIKARSPKASVFFVDYLALAPDPAKAPNPASCYLSLLHDQSFPFGAVDTVYLASLQALLNQTIDAAATAAGATVVSPYAKSLAHSPCYGTADPWVNGITTDLSSGAPKPTDTPGRQPSPTTTPPGDPKASRLGSSDVAVGSLHPNLEGAVQQSESVTHAMLRTLVGFGAPSPTSAPATVSVTSTVTGTVTDTVTETITRTVTASPSPGAGSGPTLAAPPAPGTPPAAAAAARSAGLAATGSDPGPLFLGAGALTAAGLGLLLLGRARSRRA